MAKRKILKIPVYIVFLIFFTLPLSAQHSVAREWNEVLLEAIRDDFARPTVHARNLFHTSAALYDSWAVFDDVANPFLLGNTVENFYCPLAEFPQPTNIRDAREEAMSYAAYRLLTHRFAESPGAIETQLRFDNLMLALGYDINFTSTSYQSGSPAALGNYIGSCFINFGRHDGSNEENEYENRHYEPVNSSLIPAMPGNPDLTDPNRWQPLTLEVFIDQSGNPIPGSTPAFLGPEWGQVFPFALTAADRTIFSRNGNPFWVYHDPGPPPYLEPQTGGGLSAEYQWGFALVSVWSSHLDPADNTMIDISPASFGNTTSFPESVEDLRSFYDLIEGGDPGTGRDLNPHTGQPYTTQMVPRGDYARVLAEFWADGPDSETPPGHWFTILNTVSDNPLLEKRYRGEGPIVDDLEWDIKSYFMLGGAMHDCAISAWGVKGWYDYLRPISAIRGMAEYGQSSDPGLPNYHPAGMPLIPGYIELVESGDPLAGSQDQNVGKVKLFAWRGPGYIGNPEYDIAGVGWILAEMWWPYQRPSFITPPFAGYVSGHSTYSRAAAEVLTMLTGDPFFPGGIGEFTIEKNNFLVFEKGPSVDMTLQWATYYDASDQTSLSRIWGGIHPPADDIPGRLMGIEIGVDAFNYADNHFKGTTDNAGGPQNSERRAYPNPLSAGSTISLELSTATSNAISTGADISLKIFNVLGQRVPQSRYSAINLQSFLEVNTGTMPSGIYFFMVSSGGNVTLYKVLITQ
ncbi:MAG: DUF6851 domain-containing protein [Calditrichia bacterium]